MSISRSRSRHTVFITTNYWQKAPPGTAGVCWPRRCSASPVRALICYGVSMMYLNVQVPRPRLIDARKCVSTCNVVRTLTYLIHFMLAHPSTVKPLCPYPSATVRFRTRCAPRPPPPRVSPTRIAYIYIYIYTYIYIYIHIYIYIYIQIHLPGLLQSARAPRRGRAPR